MNVFSTAFLIVLGMGTTIAQTVRFELYQYNYYFVNPAYIDTATHSFTASGGFLNRTDGIKEQDGIVGYRGNIKPINTSIGVLAASSMIGGFRFNNIGFTLSHGFDFNEHTSLALGTNIYNRRFSYLNRGVISDDFDFSIINRVSETEWRADFGLFFRMRRFFAGVNLVAPGKDDGYTNALIGSAFRIGEDFQTEHSIFGMLLQGAEHVDINNKLIIKDRFFVGLSYRLISNSGIITSAGVEVFEGFSIYSLIHSNNDEFKESKAEVAALIRIK